LRRRAIRPAPGRHPHLWLADPLARTLEVHRLEGGRWTVASTHGGYDVGHAEPFDDIEILLARWWAPGAPAVT